MSNNATCYQAKAEDGPPLLQNGRIVLQEEQKAVFLKYGLSRYADREAKRKGEPIKKWILPLGFVKWKPQDGLHFLQIVKWGILQYCVIRPTTTFAAIILNYLGLYCEQSWGLGWGHIYLSIIVSVSVTIAMYCLIQLYIPISGLVAPHRPLLRLFAIKAVVFLTFWQSIFLSLLSMIGVIKAVKYMTANDVNIGIGAVLETIEMSLFAILHIYAFSYKPYQKLDSSEPESEKTNRFRSLCHAMDFRETFREIWIGCIHLWDRTRGKESTYDIGARRTAHFTEAFGRPRASSSTIHGDNDDGYNVATLPKVHVNVEEHVDVEIEGEKQWLGIGNDYGYGLDYARRQRSESLGTQIEKELERRGLFLGLSQYFIRESVLFLILPTKAILTKKGSVNASKVVMTDGNPRGGADGEEDNLFTKPTRSSRQRSDAQDTFTLPILDDATPVPILMPHQSRQTHVRLMPTPMEPIQEHSQSETHLSTLIPVVAAQSHPRRSNRDPQIPREKLEANPTSYPGKEDASNPPYNH
ncbi:hypothetical protein H0H93_016196 [Arthromyces matolae]|nr:hypothetical protein H0H93_016196 [Arthromyces matolae]